MQPRWHQCAKRTALQSSECATHEQNAAYYATFRQLADDIPPMVKLVRNFLTGEVSKRFDDVSEVFDIISAVAKNTAVIPEVSFSRRL